MQKSKPIRILQSFDAQEWREFDKFIRSPFFNKNESLITLFTYLKKEQQNLEGPAIDREKVWQKTFGKLAFDEAKLRYAFSDLAKLLERFIAIRELDKNKLRHNQLLLEYYSTKDIEKYFNQIFDDSQKFLQKNQTRDSEFYFRNYLIEEQHYSYSSVKRDKSLDQVLQDTADHLDLYYLSKKLKLLCEMLTRQNFLNSEYTTRLREEIMVHLRDSDYSDHPAIEIYHLVLLTLVEEQNENHFKKLIQRLNEYPEFFGPEELRDLYFLAQNYCTKKINQGHRKYLRDYFNLSKLLLKKDLVYENGFILPSSFKNIVTVGLRLEEYDWVENFIYTYKNKLAPKYRENAFTYNLAWLHFFKEEYRKTLRMLSHVEYMDVYYILDSKILLLKTYFELEDVDAFFSLCDSFYVYLRRNELISAYQKTICLNFVKYVKRLMRARLGDNRASQGLLSEIRDASQVASISWLLKKAELFAKE
jgi:hypothetical protein